MKKLVVDIGNTLVKMAIFNGKETGTIWTFRVKEVEVFLHNFNKYRPYAASILSAVRDYPSVIRENLSRVSHFIELDEKISLPLKNLYETPSSLGKDRLASACGGHTLFPEEDVIVINTGTCITYDVVTAGGEYLGGSISPGLTMRLKALHTFTGRLPLLSPVSTVDVPGKNTHDSILSGALLGAIEEVNGMVARYRKVYPAARVVLSGGDTAFFENQLKSDIFVTQNIVLLGLNEILDYNV